MRYPIKTSTFSKISVALACTVMASGCAIDPNTKQPSFKETFNSDDPCSNNARNIGIGLGTVIGAVAGHQLDKNAGKFIGAGVGALVGGLIGADMDQRRCELAKVARQYNLDMTFATVDVQGNVVGDAALKNSGNASDVKKDAIGLVVSIRDQAGDGGHFETNSDKLTPRAQQYFAAIAQNYNTKKTAETIAGKKEKDAYVKQGAQRKLLLVGHTDDTGSSKFNADLSERRAMAVSRLMAEHGVPKESLYFQGAGESYPAADNALEAGRAQNRRVEIVELADDANFQKYLDARKPNYQYYRPELARASASSPVPSTASLPDSAKGGSKGNAASSPQVAKATPARARAPADREPQISPAATQKKAAVGPIELAQIDFGGAPLSEVNAVANVGKVASKKSWFSLISPAYADEPAVLHDCTRDRPRASGAVRALSDGKVYKTVEHVPGLYGKTWTDQVNGHRIIINKVAVLSNDAALARLPEFKVYTNYDPSKNRNAVPTISMTPEVNTYLGTNGVLYRIFANGSGGMNCVDILFSSQGGISAKAGKVLYTQNAKTYVADFKPTIVQ